MHKFCVKKSNQLMFCALYRCTFAKTIKITKICLEDSLREPTLYLRHQRQLQEVKKTMLFIPKAC